MAYGPFETKGYGFPIPAEEGAVGFGLINAQGETLVPPAYSYLQWFSHGMAAFLNDDGKTVSLIALDKGDPPFTPVGVFDEVLRMTDHDAEALIATRIGNVWRYVDRDGKSVGDVYDELCAFSNGFGAVRDGAVWGAMDASGTLKIDCAYEDVGQYAGGVMRIKENGQWRFITAEGTPAFAGIFEDAKDFSDGLAAVKMDGLWGFADADGTMIVEPQYEDAGSFQSLVHLAAVKKDGKWGHIDRSGKVAVKPQWDDEDDLSYVFAADRICLVVSNGKYGMVNDKGKTVLKASFSFLFPVGAGRWIAVDQKGMVTLRDSGGKVVHAYSKKHAQRFSWRIEVGSGGSSTHMRHFQADPNTYSADYFDANGKRIMPKLLGE